MWRWGIGWACQAACVCVCVCVRKRDTACPSHGNPALLIKSARAARVWGRRWPHNAHTHPQTNTHTETAGPTLGQRWACDVWPEDRCGQTSPSSALLLMGNTQQMAEAQPPFSLPLSSLSSLSLPLCSNSSVGTNGTIRVIQSINLF